MWTSFYQTHSRKLLLFLSLTFPLLYHQAHSIPTNNDIETWLPDEHSVREDYDSFKLDFGAEEIIIIAVPAEAEETGISEALADRLSRFAAIKECYTPRKMSQAMSSLRVPQHEIEQRLTGLCRSESGESLALMVLLSDEGHRRSGPACRGPQNRTGLLPT